MDSDLKYVLVIMKSDRIGIQRENPKDRVWAELMTEKPPIRFQPAVPDIDPQAIKKPRILNTDLHREPDEADG